MLQILHLNALYPLAFVSLEKDVSAVKLLLILLIIDFLIYIAGNTIIEYIEVSIHLVEARMKILPKTSRNMLKIVQNG